MSKSVYIEKNTELVEACKLGNRAAQYKLYGLYVKSMYNVCFRILNHRGEAEDVLQEAFIDAFSKIGSFRQEASFGVWLKQIVVNKAISSLRKKKMDFVDFEGEAYRLENEGFSESLSEPDESSCDYRVEAITKGVEMLPEGYRVVLSLYLFEGYDHEEISHVLGISVSTSRTQYMRGKKRLMRILEEIM